VALRHSQPDRRAVKDLEPQEIHGAQQGGAREPDGNASRRTTCVPRAPCGSRFTLFRAHKYGHEKSAILFQDSASQRIWTPDLPCSPPLELYVLPDGGRR
jgi:hypothetical protein